MKPVRLAFLSSTLRRVRSVEAGWNLAGRAWVGSSAVKDAAASNLRQDNLESLTPETAEALAVHEGVLMLNGFTMPLPQSLQPDVPD